MSNVYIKKSRIAGNGIFAKKNIKKGEFLFEVGGRIKRGAYGPDSNQKFQRYLSIWPNSITVGKNIWLNPYSSNPWRYINHSCNPNSIRKGKTIIIAFKDIKKDVEITIDYSVTEEDPEWSMKCKREEKLCRKVIKSVQFLPKKVFLKYKSYLPLFLRKSYFKSH